MKNIIKLSLLSLMMLSVFACTKETETQEAPAPSEEETIDLGVIDRGGDMAFFNFTAGNSVDVKFEIVNFNTGAVLYTKNFFSTVGSNTSFDIPDPKNTVITARFKARRNSNICNLYWNFKRGNCTTMTGTSVVTVPYPTDWSLIPPVIMVSNLWMCPG